MLPNSNEICVEFGEEIWIFQKRSAWKMYTEPSNCSIYALCSVTDAEGSSERSGKLYTFRAKLADNLQSPCTKKFAQDFRHELGSDVPYSWNLAFASRKERFRVLLIFQVQYLMKQAKLIRFLNW